MTPDALLSLVDRLVLDLARERGMSTAQVLAAYTPPSRAEASDVGACGANGAGSVATPLDSEPGGQRAMWDGGAGWL